ncbi:16S rRNA (cytidine1402-2'-O)-methyltransferase [Faunimonas pinastri]|uniref:Ribosomal RNA small subunit methyltransferase I n=1 Tax=Faunimonas pinastri TaxID=1855383 RepID=A0A1H9GYA0_9HYPH|nr:16S rRNA (cytidine(1402)-2'-O)-methyltransferase [Faunimonas pinastri]SEQ55015.1 16S rRNA (cytidine1402-2'-O)-methyltransferase [Faunimonas pinastri]
MKTENEMPEAHERSGRDYFIRGQALSAPSLEPALYIVATPVGHLADITIRALDTLAGADLVACEDTRVTRKLLQRYGIQAETTAFHDHSGPRVAERIVERLGQGKAVALVSDAGTPLVSDPGYPLVKEVLAAGHKVVPIPGASSVLTALSAGGLPTDAFLFAGFLPNKEKARRSRLAELGKVPATLVLLESPNRVGALLADAVAELGPDREAVVCREMTKLHETFDRGTLSVLAERYADGPARGEIVVLIAPPSSERAEIAGDDMDAMLREALATMRVRDAADKVAEKTGLSRRDLYQRALALKSSGDA